MLAGTPPDHMGTEKPPTIVARFRLMFGAGMQNIPLIALPQEGAIFRPRPAKSAPGLATPATGLTTSPVAGPLRNIWTRPPEGRLPRLPAWNSPPTP